MSTIHLHETTTSTPKQFIAGLTDFGPPFHVELALDNGGLREWVSSPMALSDVMGAGWLAPVAANVQPGTLRRVRSAAA